MTRRGPGSQPLCGPFLVPTKSSRDTYGRWGLAVLLVIWAHVAFVVAGCSILQHAAQVGCDVVASIPTPTCTPTATPTQAPEPLATPELITVADLGPTSWRPGILLATQDQVAGLIGQEPRKISGSISFVSYALTDQAGQSEQGTFKDYVAGGCLDLSKWGNPAVCYAGGPGGTVQNWLKVGDQLYTSKTGGDGTRRGALWVPFNRPGLWTIQVTCHATENRGTAYLCLYQVLKGRTIVHVYKWLQRSGENGTRTVTWGTFQFVD